MDITARRQTQVSDDAQPQPQPQVQVVPGPVSKEVEVAHIAPAPEVGPIIKDKELTEAGIKEVEQEIRVEEEHEKMGVKPSAESTPVRTEPTGTVQLPMTKDEVLKGKSHAGINSLGSIYSGINFANAVDFLRTLLKKHLKRLAGQPA